MNREQVFSLAVAMFIAACVTRCDSTQSVTAVDVRDASTAVTGAPKLGSIPPPLINSVTLEAYGARGDGTTNDSAAMASALSAIANGGTIQLGCGKTYKIGAGAPYTLATSNQTIVGCGQSSVLVSSTNNTLLQAKGENIRLAHFKILGSNAGGAEDGIHSWAVSSGSSDWIAEDVEVNGVGGTGFYLYYSGATLNMGPQLIGCRALNNGGPGVVTGSEYTLIVGLIARANSRGLEIDAGNVVVTSSEFVSNTTGIYQTGGGNDGHGTIAASMLNHNTNAYTVGAVGGLANGETLIGDQFFNGALNLTNTHEIRFIGSEIDVDAINLTTALGTTFEDNTWLNSCCTNTITQSGSTTYAIGANIDLTGAPSTIVAGAAWTQNGLSNARGQFTAGGGGSDYRTVIGPLTGFPASNAGMWLINNSATVSSNNVTMYGDGSNVFINGALEDGAHPIWMSWGGSTGRFKFNSDGTNESLLFDKAEVASIAQTASSSTTTAFAITAQAAGGTNAGGALALGGGAHSGSSVEDGPVKITSPLNGGWLTFTAVNGAQTLTNAQSDANFFNFAAGASGAVTINFLRAIADTSCFFAKNNTSQTITIAYLTGGTVTMATATSAIICSDGANLQKVMTGT